MQPYGEAFGGSKGKKRDWRLYSMVAEDAGVCRLTQLISHSN